MSELQFNDSARVEWTVGEGDLASSLAPDPSDVFPAVLATPKLIGLMELACARVMKPILGPGELSAGASIDMTHTAATLAGGKVTIQAKFGGRDGVLYVFHVVATDAAGEIGRATHKRALVSSERLLAGARKRQAAGQI
ncbi:MAG: thioesterase family protein [Chthoniobacteraceae bacterium]